MSAEGFRATVNALDSQLLAVGIGCVTPDSMIGVPDDLYQRMRGKVNGCTSHWHYPVSSPNGLASVLAIGGARSLTTPGGAV